MSFSKSIVLISLCLLSQSGLTGILFLDSLESGDLSASTASTNTANFRWTDANRSSILTQDGTTAIREYPTQYLKAFTDGRDVTAKTGNRSLGIEYAAGVEMAEQRFSLDPQNELWLGYWIRVPENYSHGTLGGASNNKFLALWMDGYIQAGTGTTVVLSMENAGNGNTDLAFTYTQPNGDAVAFQQHAPFINIATDRGRWMQIVIHLNFGTTNGSDSTLETWRKWEGENSFTLLHQTNTANMTKGSAAGWGGGYFLGWANGAYAEDTWWLIDDVTISTSSLLTTNSPAVSPPGFKAESPPK
tara:strand:+ start:3735 stop:4640 length:906 start_codon:yes stop_codon:yes gene_type:complete